MQLFKSNFFCVAVFYINKKAFIAFITFLILIIMINLVDQTLITLLLIKKNTLELTKHLNIAKFYDKLLKLTSINNYTTDLIKNKKALCNLIYNFGLIELEILKTYKSWLITNICFS